MISRKFWFHCWRSFFIDVQFGGMNKTSDSEQNSTGLLGDNGLEESEGIDPAHLEEWMEAIDAYKADAELRRHNEFCMFPLLSFGVS